MFERFTDPARRVIILAQDEARLLKHNYVGTEHILLGLLAEEDSVGARALERLGLALEGARAQVVRLVGSTEEPAAGELPLTPRVKKVLELALREALSLDHNYIGTEHILLGLNIENEGVAERILRDADTDVETVRCEVVRLVQAPDYRAPERSTKALEPLTAPPRRTPSRLPEPGRTQTRLGHAEAGARLPAQASAARRFDDAAAHAIELALADALSRDDPRITCEHLLAGLAAGDRTLAQRVLAEHGLDPDGVRAELKRPHDS